MPRTTATDPPSTPNRLVSRIVTPIQGSSQEMEVQQWAIELATALGADLRLVTISTDGMVPPKDIFAWAADLASQRGVRLETGAINGQDVVGELLDELGPTDLVVIGTRRLGNGPEPSVTEALIREAPCPVQVLRLS